MVGDRIRRSSLWPAGAWHGRNHFGDYPDDLKAYVRRVFARDMLKIAIVGNIDAAKASEIIDKVFAGLPAKGNCRRSRPPNRKGSAAGSRSISTSRSRS